MKLTQILYSSRTEMGIISFFLLLNQKIVSIMILIIL